MKTVINMLFKRPSPYRNARWAITGIDMRSVYGFAETMEEASRKSREIPVETQLVCLGKGGDIGVLRRQYKFHGVLTAPPQPQRTIEDVIQGKERVKK